MRAYHASLAFAAERPDRENSTWVQFLAEDDRAAALDIRRWYASRQENWPEYFRELYCIKIYHLNLRPIDPTGAMDPPTGMCVFEWKYDTAGLPYEDYVEHRLGNPVIPEREPYPSIEMFTDPGPGDLSLDIPDGW